MHQQQTAWAIQPPGWPDVLVYTLRRTRAECIAHYEDAHRRTWPQLYRAGQRCVRVLIAPENDNFQLP